MSDIKKNIMKKISEDEVKMRSKSLCLLLKAMGEIALIALVALLVYVVNISFYLPQRDFHLIGEEIKFVGGIVPFEHIIFAILLFSLAVWAIYKYTDFYKKNWLVFVLGFLGAILLLGFFLTRTPINRGLERESHFKPFYRPGLMRGRDIEMRIVPNKRFEIN